MEREGKEEKEMKQRSWQRLRWEKTVACLSHSLGLLVLSL
jgi:hypothetical protein